MSHRMCPACDAKLVRRDKENEHRFAMRVFCDKRCFQRARRKGRLGAVWAAGSWQSALGKLAEPLP